MVIERLSWNILVCPLSWHQFSVKRILEPKTAQKLITILWLYIVFFKLSYSIHGEFGIAVTILFSNLHQIIFWRAAETIRWSQSLMRFPWRLLFLLIVEFWRTFLRNKVIPYSWVGTTWDKPQITWVLKVILFAIETIIFILCPFVLLNKI